MRRAFPDITADIDDVAAEDRVAGRLLAEEWICSDSATLMQQIT